MKKLRIMIKRRLSGEPFQHIIAKAPFYGRDFTINCHVLVPRPETGTLIERLKRHEKVKTLLDVGTGSGCIAITCSLEGLAENIFATDISHEALKIAQQNIQLYNITNIKTAHHDFLKRGFKSTFDVVVSNPPYIRKDEMCSLSLDVRDCDPEIALTDGDDGLVFYRRFADQFYNLLNPGGFILIEISGGKNKDYIEILLNKAGLKTEFFKDLQGDWRGVEIRR